MAQQRRGVSRSGWRQWRHRARRISGWRHRSWRRRMAAKRNGWHGAASAESVKTAARGAYGIENGGSISGISIWRRRWLTKYRSAKA